MNTLLVNGSVICEHFRKHIFGQFFIIPYQIYIFLPSLPVIILQCKMKEEQTLSLLQIYQYINEQASHRTETRQLIALQIN